MLFCSVAVAVVIVVEAFPFPPYPFLLSLQKRESRRADLRSGLSPLFLAYETSGDIPSHSSAVPFPGIEPGCRVSATRVLPLNEKE